MTGHTAKVGVSSNSACDDRMVCRPDVFLQLIQCSRVSEPVTSPSNVASSDTEWSDTVTESAD